MPVLLHSAISQTAPCSIMPPVDGREWKTDVICDKVVVVVKLKERSFIESIQIKNKGASHIEIRGGEGEVLWKDAVRVVGKTMLRSMWDHKAGINEAIETNLVSKEKTLSFGYILIGVFNNWEPPCELGLQSYTITGHSDPSPVPYPAEVSSPSKKGPIVINPHLPLAVEQVKPPVAPATAIPTQLQPPQPAQSKPKVFVPKKLSGSKRPAEENSSDKKIAKISTTPLKGVTVCLSGFKNPERSNLRDEACKLGARCTDDWSKGGTHLVCAYYNTPKYKEVAASGKGHIVTKDWITAATATGSRRDESAYRLRKK
eukprot:TRINITY_DN1886_c0_g1_i1.p1 TRINITY_DN1886_c0_g1~~TRINITY_DN1886_c0_g1_i1.p1  ORF type:complete len:315 (+),score=41.47 TRINITY_DN1886_c0_g1_i1:87-1031(+)